MPDIPPAAADAGLAAGSAPPLGGMARLTPALRAVAAGTSALHALAPRLTTEIMLRHFTQPRRSARRDYRDQLPTGAYRLHVPYDNRHLAAWGWGFSGPAVLLIHGWEANAGSMLHLVPALLDRGYRVCVLDLPGHGLSPRAPTHLVDASFALEAMLRSYGRFQSIVAHSFGAAALCLTLEREDTLTPDRIALVSPMPGMDQHLRIFATIAGLSAARAEQLRARLAAILGCPPDDVCALTAAGRLAVDALVIHDRHDPVIPHSAGESMARTVRCARLVTTTQLGHRRILRCPQVQTHILTHLHPDAAPPHSVRSDSIRPHTAARGTTQRDTP